MGELIRIGEAEGAPGLGASVDTTGAWVTSLSDGINHILFPKDLVAVRDDQLKPRGGMHICSPYFGPDPEKVGPQHGFARDVEWEVTNSGSRYVCLRHTSPRLQQDVGIQIVNIGYLQMLITNLSLTNKGEGEIMVAPGVHPYFSGPARYGECHQEARKDAASERVENYGLRSIELASGVSVNMVTTNLENFTAWSDNPDEYHCIEPSVLSLAQTAGIGEVLRPGDSRSYTISLRVESKGTPN